MQLNETHEQYHFQYGSDHALGHFITVYDSENGDPNDDDGIIFEVDMFTQRGTTPELTALAKEVVSLSYNGMLQQIRKYLNV